MSDEDPDDSDYASISGELSACESSVASEFDDHVSIHSHQHEAPDASLFQEVTMLSLMKMSTLASFLHS
jgi:hypothetical protein